MFIRIFFLLIFGLSILTSTELRAANQITAENVSWISLFNGKNLDNWIVQSLEEDRKKSFWTVVDGAILLDATGSKRHSHVWLQTKEEFSDFELTLKFQSFRGNLGNSGIQIRSRYDSSAQIEGEKGKGWLDGPQVDINLWLASHHGYGYPR